jgi:hypothetical protein
VIIVLDCRSVYGSPKSSALLNSADCVYILGQRSVKLINLKQLKQFNLFYAAHITTLPMIFIRVIPSTALLLLISKVNVPSKDKEFSSGSPKTLLHHFADTEEIGSTPIYVGALAS